MFASRNLACTLFVHCSDWMLCLHYPALEEKILGSVTNAGLVGVTFDIAAYVSFLYVFFIPSDIECLHSFL